ncbi:MAG: AAA family ATPase [Armatimonadota bacterium]|jgi:hypothetical protein
MEFDPATACFKQDADYPLRGDVFVIDAMSMVDLLLAHQLVRAIPPHAIVVMVGDVDQLPSAGPGSVLMSVRHRYGSIPAPPPKSRSMAANGAPRAPVCGFRWPAGVVPRLPAVRGAVGACASVVVCEHDTFPLSEPAAVEEGTVPC